MGRKKKKTMADFREYLATFQPEYPLKKGYVGRLILEERARTIASVQKQLVDFVQPLEQDREISDTLLTSDLLTFRVALRKLMPSLTLQWSKFIDLCDEPFSIRFELSKSSGSALPTPSQPSDAPSTSYFSGRSTSGKSGHDCKRCVDKQHMYRTILAGLRKKFIDRRKRHTLEMAQYSSLFGAHKIIKRKENSRRLWKAKYFDLLATSTNDAKEASGLATSLNDLKKENSDLIEKLKEKDNILQETVVINKNLKQDNFMLFRDVEKLQKGIAILSKTNEKLKKDQGKKPRKDLQSVSSTSAAAENTSSAKSVLKDEQVPNVLVVRLNPSPDSRRLNPQDLTSLDANEEKH